MQLGGSHDHPIILHIRSCSASGNDFDVASFPRAKRHEPYRQSELRSGRRKTQLQSILGDEEDRQVLAALMPKGGDEKLHGADVKGHSTDNRL